MSKTILAALMLLLLLLFGPREASSGNSGKQRSTLNAQHPTLNSGAQSQGQSGTLQKMIVENGNVTLDLDLNRLNGVSSASQQAVRLQFAVAANSFFTILVFNDLLRGPDHGSMALVPAAGSTPPATVFLNR